MTRFVKRLTERRLGFLVDEVMTGTHRFQPGFGERGTHAMEYRITWGPDHLGDWLDPRSEQFLSQPLVGSMTIGGLCHATSCRGELALRYFTERSIVYTIDFQAGGVDYRYLGQKVDIRPWNLHRSHTTCYGELREADSGALVSTSTTHFRLRTIPSFLASVRAA